MPSSEDFEQGRGLSVKRSPSTRSEDEAESSVACHERGLDESRARVEWCGRGDSNPHALASASPSSWCVCQFRHFRKKWKDLTCPSVPYFPSAPWPPEPPHRSNRWRPRMVPARASVSSTGGQPVSAPAPDRVFRSSAILVPARRGLP